MSREHVCLERAFNLRVECAAASAIHVGQSASRSICVRHQRRSTKLVANFVIDTAAAHMAAHRSDPSIYGNGSRTNAATRLDVNECRWPHRCGGHDVVLVCTFLILFTSNSLKAPYLPEI